MNLSQFLVFLVIIGKSSSFTITTDGGISTSVAISSNVPEEKDLLQILEKIFTELSAVLHKATDYREYLDEVTVHVPSTWKLDHKYLTSLRCRFSEADFRVDSPNEEYGDEPFTFQPEGCGQPARFSSMTPNFLKTMTEPTNVDKNGCPGLRFLQMFSKQRYGVYDEKQFGKHPNVKHGYWDSNENLKPNVCPANQSVIYFNSKGTLCSPEDEKDCLHELFDKFGHAGAPINCHTTLNLITSPRTTSIKSSIMGELNLNTTFGFCHNTHNPMAPNMQNHICQHKSVWEIVNRSLTKKRPSMPLNIKPTFKFVRFTGGSGSSVILLDVSEKMKGEPILLLHDAISFVVNHNLPDDVSIGLVKYWTHRKTLMTLRQMTKPNKAHLLPLLPMVTKSGGAEIGRGLQLALKNLGRTNGITKSQEGGTIVLISSGQETGIPTFMHILDYLVEKSVVVHIFALGEEAGAKLEPLAKMTGGRLIIIENNMDMNVLIMKLTEVLIVYPDVELAPVKVVSETVMLLGSEITIPLIIDEKLGRNNAFVVSGRNLSTVTVELLAPDEKLFDSKSRDYWKQGDKMILFSFWSAESGQYNMTIKTTTNFPLSVNIALMSQPRTVKRIPVRLYTWLKNTQEVFPSLPHIYAQLTNGDKPVIKASVNAVIQGPDSKTTTELKDDGSYPDIIPHDGVYTGIPKEINGNHRYDVIVYAKNNKETCLLNKKFEDEKTEDCVITQPFQRVDDSWYFKIKGWFPNQGDIVRSCRITDLLVLDTMGKNVTMSWTSPGDDCTSGTASFLDIRGSSNFLQVIQNPQKITKFNETMVITGSLSSLPAGECQKISLFVHDEMLMGKKRFYFILRAVDEMNNAAEWSNIVHATIVGSIPTNVPRGSSGKPEIPLLITNTSIPDNTSIISVNTCESVSKHVDMIYLHHESLGYIIAIIALCVILSGFVSFVCYQNRRKWITKYNKILDYS